MDGGLHLEQVRKEDHVLGLPDHRLGRHFSLAGVVLAFARLLVAGLNDVESHYLSRNRDLHSSVSQADVHLAANCGGIGRHPKSAIAGSNPNGVFSSCLCDRVPCVGVGSRFSCAGTFCRPIRSQVGFVTLSSMLESSHARFRFTLRTAVAAISACCIWLAAAAASPVLACAALLIVSLVFLAIGIALGSVRLFVIGIVLWLPILLVQCW
jgi:hypothetical protein